MKSKSPFIFSNLAISIDGKIAPTSREHFPIGTAADRLQMQVLRKKSDVVIFGASTLRTFKKVCGLRKSTLGKQPANVVVSTNLDGFSTEWPFFKDQTLRKILFVDKRISSNRLLPFKDICEIYKIDSKKSIASQISNKLFDLGFKRLLVEGGGGLMWDFVSENLINEYHLTITPRVIGGTNAPTLVDGLGFGAADIVNLKLKSVKKIKNELYLVYGKTEHRGK